MKRIELLAAIALAAAALTGCAKTPEQAIVREKGSQSLENYKEEEPLSVAPEETEAGKKDGAADEAAQETENAGEAAKETNADEAAQETETGETAQENGTNALAMRLSVPQLYEASDKSEDGSYELSCRAQVFVPDVDKVAVYQVGRRAFDQELIDHVTEVFFGDAPIYNAATYNMTTKAEALKELNQLKAWKAEGNLDPYGMIADAKEQGLSDEEANQYFDLQQEIDIWEEAYENAPEEASRDEIEAGLNSSFWVDENGERTYSEGKFIGVVEMDGAIYQYILNSYESMPMDIRIRNMTKAQKSGSIYWYAPDYSDTGEAVEAARIPEEEAKKTAGITPKEAQEMADGYLQKLGLAEEFSAKTVQLTICRMNDRYGYSTQVIDAGYEINYTRDIDGFPVTDEESIGGALEGKGVDIDTTLETWAYEKIKLVVNSEGLQYAEINNLYEVKEKQVENVKLLSFPEIAGIFEQMLKIKEANLDMRNYAKFDITQVKLGYMRIYEPSVDGTTGLLVPVWDFFGSLAQEYEYEGEKEYFVVNRPTYSHMTINAADGTVIDRQLGY